MGMKTTFEQYNIDQAIYWFRKMVSAIKALGNSVPFAGFSDDNGAIAIWIGEDGIYRGTLWRFQIVTAEIECTTRDELVKWLKKHIQEVQ